MTDTLNNGTIEYGNLRSSVMQGTRTICYIKAVGSAIRRAGILLFFLLAMSPIFELFGLMSISSIISNASRTGSFSEFFSFFSTAFMNAEIEVQTIASLAVLGGLIISFSLLKEIFGLHFGRNMR